jgi:hypothetical protein
MASGESRYTGGRDALQCVQKARGAKDIHSVSDSVSVSEKE